MNCEIVKSLTLLNLVPRSHAPVRTEINFLSRFGRPTIEERFSKMAPQDDKSRNLVRILKEKENNEYENEIEVL